jgi:NAD+ diphosphatase
MVNNTKVPLSNLPGNVFSGSPLDRQGLNRKNKAWIRQKMSAPSSRFVVYWRDRHLIQISSDIRPFFTRIVDISEFLDGNEEIVFLGIMEDKEKYAYFGVDLSHIPESTIIDRFPGTSLMDIRDTVQVIENTDASIIACSRGLLYWHSRSRYCGICGSKTKSFAAGHERKCTKKECGVTHFPRTDPAVIVLVYNGDMCLLGRQSKWPTGMHSTLAGFLEPGESLEETVRREVFEESGVLVTDIIYHSSQPWPLPSSLMIGFTARAYTTELNIDFDELENVVWVSRKDLKSFEENDSFRLPGDYSIARRLIEDWLMEE